MRDAAARNPHAGRPFDDDDATIAAALEDVSIPALLCSLVHLTGDPSWVRGPVRPLMAVPTDFQSGIDAAACAEVRRRALPAIAAFRDGGGVLPPPPSPELVVEMMSFLGCEPVKPEFVPMFVEDLHLTTDDTGRIDWGDEVSDAQRADSHAVIVGCGESGILAAIRLQQAGIPFTIIEKNAGPGGTWWENHYPGSRVDIPSHFYCYSFEPADHWTEYFARQPELREYFVRIVRERDLERRTRFETRVTAARWDAARGRWSVEVVDAQGRTDHIDARFVISAVGSLNVPKLPDIPGMDTFAGPSFHSARWDHTADHRGTRFALVGAGASGFQIAPTIADEVEHLTVFQRTAQWMFPNPVYHRAVPAGDAWAMRHLPFYARWFRFQIFYPASGLSAERLHMDPDWHDPDGLTVSEMNAQRRKMLTQWIESQLADRPDILARVIPDYPTSGKRMLQDNGSWLRTLKKPNVTLVRTGIERIVPDGIVDDDGTHHPADVICYATGFRPYESLSPVHVVGRDGVVLGEQWGNEPTAYLGITVPNFPNFFCLYGPGTSLSVGASLIFQSERQVTFVLAAIHETLASGHRTIEVRPEVHDGYAARYRVEADRLVQSHPSVKHSHYKNDAGKIYTLNPWPVPTYWRWTHQCDPADFHFA
jgi:4-hydroxyacetophenone monooxygenase